MQARACDVFKAVCVHMDTLSSSNNEICLPGQWGHSPAVFLHPCAPHMVTVKEVFFFFNFVIVMCFSAWDSIVAFYRSD